MASSATATTDPTVDLEEKTTELTEESVANPDVEVEDLLEVDRFQQRLDRFGTIAPEAKKISRALRFGTTHETVDEATKKRRLEKFGALPDRKAEEQDKKRQRAERFNANTPTSTIDEETKQKRIDRFGAVKPSTNNSMKNAASKDPSPADAGLSDAIKKRTERFGDISQVAKANTLTEQKAKRAERFKPITTA